MCIDCLFFLVGVINDQVSLMLYDEIDFIKIDDETEDIDKLLEDLEVLQDLNKFEIIDLLEKQKKVNKVFISIVVKDVFISKLFVSKEIKNKIFEGSY